MRGLFGLALGLCALAKLAVGPVLAGEAIPAPLIETPSLKDEVLSGRLPAIAARIPAEPSIVRLTGPHLAPGRHGGDLRVLMARQKDIRQVVVFGYARLVGYDRKFRLKADILKSFKVEDGRIFTFTLRQGHKWSDGHPFTPEDFRYYWQDMALDKDISPHGPPKSLLVNGKLPKFEILGPNTIRYSWDEPNPFFLPALARPNPLWIYRPAHYLKQFHAKYVAEAELQAKVEAAHKRNWRALHFSRDRQYRYDNPDQPTLQPWISTMRPPAERFVFSRNPYYHRIDTAGRQLPYLDKMVVSIASAKLIPAKVGTGESDLQARYVQFKNYTFLKQGEKRNNFEVRLWKTAKGSQMALYPNLNVTDPVWAKLVRQTDFRRALSLAIDRHEINQVVFYGLATEGNDTVLAESPLYRDSFRTRWAKYDLAQANLMLDRLGLDKRGSGGIRLLPDGRPMEIIVETAGEDSDQADVLELIRDTWRQAGIRMFIKPTRREVLRRRAKAGKTVMSIWFGLGNGLAGPDTPPADLAPTRDDQLQWPKWGFAAAASRLKLEDVDVPPVRRLLQLNNRWIRTGDSAERTRIWEEMLEIWADQALSIGLVSGVLQPVCVRKGLRNVPQKALYNWDPGADFGVYRPDTFWFDDAGEK
ncbi:MAG: peptide ABC transporter substrate-binding protein [Hyphomicrobiales bacterium]|nr:MAG: peptide ABC transporter substrate-binding protein [Hyphomicrobiales bacterium]